MSCALSHVAKNRNIISCAPVGPETGLTPCTSAHLSKKDYRVKLKKCVANRNATVTVPIVFCPLLLA